MTKEKQAPISTRLLRAVRAHQSASDAMDTAVAELMGINRTDGSCLDVIDQHGRMPAGGIARELGLTSGAVTAVIDRLERAGYVRRVSDPEDRRRVLIELTEQARLITGLVYGRMGELGMAMMGRMSEESQRMVVRFLEVGTSLNREMAAGVRKHVPSGPADFEDRLKRARNVNRDQALAVARLETLLTESGPESDNPD